MITVLAVALLMHQTPGDAPRKVEPAPVDRVVCRNEPQPGTRITTAVCMSQQDWSNRRQAMEQHRARVRPVIDNRRLGRGIGRW